MALIAISYDFKVASNQKDCSNKILEQLKGTAGKLIAPLIDTLLPFLFV